MLFEYCKIGGKDDNPHADKSAQRGMKMSLRTKSAAISKTRFLATLGMTEGLIFGANPHQHKGG